MKSAVAKLRLPRRGTVQVPASRSVHAQAAANALWDQIPIPAGKKFLEMSDIRQILDATELYLRGRIGDKLGIRLGAGGYGRVYQGPGPGQVIKITADPFEASVAVQVQERLADLAAFPRIDQVVKAPTGGFIIVREGLSDGDLPANSIFAYEFGIEYMQLDGSSLRLPLQADRFIADLEEAERRIGLQLFDLKGDNIRRRAPGRYGHVYDYVVSDLGLARIPEPSKILEVNPRRRARALSRRH